MFKPKHLIFYYSRINPKKKKKVTQSFHSPSSKIYHNQCFQRQEIARGGRLLRELHV
ncbi:hypothetical protein ACE6H2_011297 [Prunus campanulata]